MIHTTLMSSMGMDKKKSSSPQQATLTRAFKEGDSAHTDAALLGRLVSACSGG